MRQPRKFVATVVRTPRLSKWEVERRVLASVRALRAMSDPERRFLLAGTKSGWVQTLVEWSDLVARAESREETPDTFRHDPTRAEIADAMIAGEWFARLAILPKNVREFEGCVARYRAGWIKSPRIEDQRIVSWVAFGFSFKAVGERIRTNEHEAERRFSEIVDDLWEIANGTAKFADIEARERSRRQHQTNHGAGGIPSQHRRAVRNR